MKSDDQVIADSACEAWGFRPPGTVMREAVRPNNPYVVELERIEGHGVLSGYCARGEEAIDSIDPKQRAQIEKALALRGWTVSPGNVVWVHDTVRGAAGG